MMNLWLCQENLPFTELSDIVIHEEIRVRLEPEHNDYLAKFELQLNNSDELKDITCIVNVDC